MSATTTKPPMWDEPMGRCWACEGSGLLRLAVDDIYDCHECGGTGELPNLYWNYMGEKATDRYVVRQHTSPLGSELFTVWDRQTGDRVQTYGSRVGGNRLCFGLNLGWDLRESRSYADRGDRWAHAS